MTTDLIKERQAERAQCSFPIRAVTNFLDGSEEETCKLESIMASFERDPLFKVDDYSLNWQEKRELTFKRIAKLLPFTKLEDYSTFVKRFQILGIFDGSTLTRYGVHLGLFCQTVAALGTDEQVHYWTVEKGAANLEKFYGCFGMTELTHGSNVAKLETEAHFDPEKDGFFINTPHLGATKWWIGGAAHSATHCVVYARLIVKGKDYGVKNFVVQLRDINSGELLPGIAVGDIGKKMGRDGVDNGWIQFSRVWIPRFNMLSKFTQVDSKGNVTLPKFEQLSYTALVNGRVSMVSDSYQVGKKFITVALRYATIRRQFGKDEATGLEKKIIDYPHHRRRLFPLLATIFAFNSSAMEVTRFNAECQKLAASGDVKQAIPNLKDLFALSAGMKAFATWEVCKIIDESRQACGGHGYSAYNDFGKGYDDWVVQCTWEGDNNVLSLSCGRALIQNFLTLEKGGKVGQYSQYIGTTLDSLTLSVDQLDDVDHLISAWEFVSSKLISQGASKFKTFFAQSSDIELAFEKASSNRFEIAKIHTKLTTLKTFYARVREANPDIKPVLTSLAQLYALHITSENIAQFYSSGIIVNGSQFYDALNDKIDSVNEKLRPDIIGLTDSFNLSDFFIGAKIGNYDGNAYENYFKFVNSQTKEGGYKPHYYDTVYKPFLHRDTSLNDNQMQK